MAASGSAGFDCFRFHCVAEKVQGSNKGEWTLGQRLKKALLLSFRLNDMTAIGGPPGGANFWDKVPSKFLGMADSIARRR